MSKQIINVGSGELVGDGEGLRSAFIKINANFDEVYTDIAAVPTALSGFTNDVGYITEGNIPTNVSVFVNDAGYLTTSTMPPATNLGNLYVTGTNLQSIAGSIHNANIELVPHGTGGVSVPKLNIPVGTILESTVPIIASIADLELDSVIDRSTGPSDALTAGQYGLTNGIPAPWAVYQFTTSPSPVVQVDDVLGGAGIPSVPSPSVILAVGTGTWSNTVIAYSDFSSLALPLPGTVVTVARATTHAAMNIQTNVLTDINLNVGVGGKVVTHASILPYDTNTVDLGSPAKRFRKVWLGGGTIYVLDETLGTDQAIGARDGNLYIDGGAGLRVGEFTFRDNTIAIANNTRDIIIGTTTATGEVIFNRPLQVNTPAGQQSFSVTRFGLTKIFTPGTLLNTESALEIVGTSTRQSQSRNFTGTLLQLTAQDGQAARVSIDSFGTGLYPVLAGRQAGGTVTTPTATVSGDTLFRISGQGHTGDAYLGTIARFNLQATENFTASNGGTRVRFQLTPTGSTTIQTVTADIDATGLSLVGNSTGGITFRDSTRQITAWTGTVVYSSIVGTPTNLNQFSNTTTNFITSASITWDNVQNKPSIVNQLIAGVGLTVTTSSGVIGINATGVQNVSGTPNRVIVTDAGSKNLTLTTPQDLATTSSVTFQNITVTGNLNVNGTATIVTNASIVGKILYLANSATNAAQIDGGGIILGTSTFARSILYSLNDNWWDTNGAGLKTQQLNATTSTVTHLDVTGTAHFGTAYEDNQYANSAITVNANVNSYSQIVNVNHNTGTSASSDFVAVNNIGNDSNNYIDLGINSSVYSDPAYNISGANDGYLFVNGGNITIGTQSAGKNIVFHTGGTTSSNLRATITDAGLTVVGTLNGLTLPSTSTTAGYVLSNNGTGTLTWVQPQTGYTGSAGTNGTTGYTGSQGSAGVGYTGSQGTQGAQGDAGYTGSRGAQGVLGFTGSVGFTGSAGAGYTGSKGDTGSQGNIGYTGSKGDTGAIGNTGATGFTGSTGTQGVIGFTGSKGDTGAIGNTGATGFTGSIGGLGYTGSAGAGYTGSAGIGYTGSASTATGFTGSQGNQGSPGYTGSAGVGYTGSQGTQGTQGNLGYTGSQGNQGSPGYTGSQGTQGNLGYTGSAGTGSIAIRTIGVVGDGAFTATSTTSSVYFSAGGRMVLNIATGSNIITITDYAKGSKKHRAKHKDGSYDPDIDMTQPEDTIVFAEGGGIVLATNSGTNTLTIAAEFTGTTVLHGTLTVNPTSVSKTSVATQTFTITGLTTGHKIVVSPATALTYGILVSAAWASASNTVSIQFMNISGSSIDLGNIEIDYFAWV
jgi:hypothetical protein